MDDYFLNRLSVTDACMYNGIGYTPRRWSSASLNWNHVPARASLGFRFVRAVRAAGGANLQYPEVVVSRNADEDTLEREILLWRRETTGVFATRRYPGDHFFLKNPSVMRCLCSDSNSRNAKLKWSFAMDENRSEALIAGIVPPEVMCCEQVGILGGALLGGETELLSPNTVSKRREEFTAGRTCARAALALSGVTPTPILQGKRGEPLWPDHVIGSITHCSGYCAAAVTSGQRYRSLGIDAEPNEALPPEVLGLIARAEERQWIAERRDDGVYWDRILFSIKESVYKVWFPLERRWLDFHQAHVQIDVKANLFKATLMGEVWFCPRVIEGKYKTTQSLILTCAWA
jgi:4'-phosphopantetheinyl transferase EntD